VTIKILIDIDKSLKFALTEFFTFHKYSLSPGQTNGLR